VYRLSSRLGVRKYTFLYTFVYTRLMPKVLKSFKFNPQLYASFKELAAKNGYTVTAALEKFMMGAVEYGLVFPSAVKTEAVEAEARVMLAWLEKDKYWVSLDREQEISTRGRLLQLLPKVENAQLRAEIEETLKKKS
jgi:hypothetical protein